MTTERSGEIPICPYWRKYFQYGDHILAMCAVESENSPPYRDLEGGPRLRECPLYGPKAVIVAFEMPGICEFKIGDPVNETEYAVGSDFSGRAGIFQLEDIWEKEVEKFIERHSQTS